MDQTTFVQSFPEFRRVDPSIVASKLAFAAAKMGGPDFTVWPPFATAGQAPSLSDVAHGYLTAHLLQTAPFGAPTRLEPQGTDGRSTYLAEYEDICQAVGGGFIVAGVLGGQTTTPGTGQLQLSPGTGTVALVHGSLGITFSVTQAMPAGTVLAFVGAQPGALYALAANVLGTSGTLTAEYTGPSNPASSWNGGPG